MCMLGMLSARGDVVLIYMAYECLSQCFASIHDNSCMYGLNLLLCCSSTTNISLSSYQRVGRLSM